MLYGTKARLQKTELRYIHTQRGGLCLYQLSNVTCPKVKSTRGRHGVTVRQTVATAFRGFQGSAVGTRPASSTLKCSSKLRGSLASLTVHQVEEIKLSFLLTCLGIDCAKLSVQVDQEVSGPIYNLTAALARPTYQEISAVSLVRKVS